MTRGLPLGGALDFDLTAARGLGAEWASLALDRASEQQPVPVSVDRADYAAPYNSTSATPTGPAAGVSSAYGRVWAEGRSLTCSGGSGAFGLTLISSQNGVRCMVSAPAGSTITGGSVRFWTFDPVRQVWACSSVEEVLATGVRDVATSDQFSPVGAR